MKKLVYTVQGLQSAEDEQLICELLPDVLRAYGSDGNVTADAQSASVSFGVPRTVSCEELEQSIDAVLAPHGMMLLPPPNVRYYAYTGKKSKPKNIPLSVYIASLISAISITLVITMLLTSLVSGAYFNLVYGADPSNGEINNEVFNMVKDKIDQEAYGKVDTEAMTIAMIKAYVAATGDPYAEYYTPEEFAAMTSENQGKMQGIGVSVINTTTDHNGVTQSAIEIIMVYPNSPAEKADIRPGDKVIKVKHEGKTYTIEEAGGYTAALNYLRGEAGTLAEFTVVRKTEQGFEELDFSVKREAFESTSVTSKVSKTNSEVGIVMILQFDLTTPEQFEAAVDDLIAKGCDKFVFDVRNNPGGDLESIKAVLSYFLEVGNPIVYTEDNKGNETEDCVQVIKHPYESYAGCDVTADEIGKYSELTFSVITNGNTASAAELFTATVRDYELGTIVGQTTYGKGCMQTIYSLGKYGGLKLTTRMYYSMCHESYHDIGITPHVTVELSAEAQEYNLYVLPEELDDQLQAAIGALN